LISKIQNFPFLTWWIPSLFLAGSRFVSGFQLFTIDCFGINRFYSFRYVYPWLPLVWWPSIVDRASFNHFNGRWIT